MSEEEINKPHLQELAQNPVFPEVEDTEVAAIIEKTSRSGGAIYLINTLTVLFFILLLVAFASQAETEKTFVSYLWIFGASLLFGGSLIGSLVLAHNFFREGKQVMTRIDKRGINSLAQMVIHSSGTRLNPIALHRFLEVLLTMNASDATRINASTRLLIQRTLTTGHTETILTLLRGLEQAGDSWCVPQLKILISPVFATQRKRYQEIKAQAQRTLDFIEQRIEEGKNATTLLRPSTATHDPQTLLRPLAQAPDPAPQILLRPSQNDER